MTHLFALWFALFAAQATIPATPPLSEPFPTQQPFAAAPSTGSSPDQAAPAKPPLCPNPDASGNYHVGCGVKAPVVINQSEPQFSEIAREQKISGIVAVSLIVDVQGKPENVHVTKSIADTVDSKHRAAALTLDQAAIDTVKNYKFKPATKDGKPVPIILNVTIKFEAY